MELFYFPLSTYSQKVLIALHEKGMSFTPHLVNLMVPAARTEYETLYPIGKIPLLRLADGHLLPESSTIIEYLDSESPTPRLIPEGAEDGRQARFMERICDLYLNDPVVSLLFAGMKPEAERDQPALAKARKHLDASYRHLDQRLASQSWLLGEQFSIADCAAIPPLFYAQGAYSFEQYANLTAYWQRAQQRPSYRKVMQEFVPIWQDFARQQAA